MHAARALRGRGLLVRLEVGVGRLQSSVQLLPDETKLVDLIATV